MIHLAPVVIVAFSLLMPGMATAQDTITRTTTLKVADPHIDLDNGRTYILKNGTVIEEIELDANNIQRNIFDFSNGVVYHERPNGVNNASYGTTAFSQLPPGRVDEIKVLGCEIAGKAGALVRNKDDVGYFRERYCGDK